MTKMKRTTAIAGLAVIAMAAAGCSSSGSSSTTSSGSSSSGGGTVDFYSSLPMQGASSAQTIPLVNGIKLALAQANSKAGQWTVNYQVLDDSTAAAGKWDPGQTAANARKVASDSKAVYYMGEFNSGASEVSIPILNEAGIPQVSPANTYVGLTTNLPGSAPGEPQKYYPSGNRTYLRIVPIDSIQAAADLMYARGVNGTTLDDVRAATGTSKSQLYRHFPDKEALVHAVITLRGQQILDRETQRLGRLSSFSGLTRWRNALIQVNSLQNGAFGCALGSMANELADQDEQARVSLAASSSLTRAWSIRRPRPLWKLPAR